MNPCQAAETLSRALYMKCLLTVKIFTCITGMILIVWNFKKNGLSWLGHINAKCIFFLHLVFSFLVATFFCTLHILDLTRLSLYHEDPCLYRVPVTLSFSIRLPCQVCIYMQLMTMFLLSLERVIALWNPVKYEKTTTPTFAIFSIALIITFSTIFPLELLLPGVNLDRSYTGFVTKTPENADKFRIVILFQLFPQIAALFLFHFVRYKSKRSTASDLPTRYQMEENQRICHHLLPVFYSHAFILIISAGGISLIPYIQIFSGLDDVTFAMALESIGWTPLYATLMPIIVHLRHFFRFLSWLRLFLSEMDFCSAGRALSQSFFMKCLLFGKLSTCIVGMILIVWILFRYGIKWLGHINAKLIFFAHIFFTFLVVFNFSLVHAIDLLRLSKFHEDSCEYLVPVTLSFALRVPCQIFIYIQVLTMFSLAIERLLAVRSPREYERIKQPTLAVVFVGLSITFSICFVLSMFLPGVDFSRSYPGFVSRTKENATRYYIVIIFQLLPETLTLIIFNIVREKSKKARNSDLNSRYQLEENRKICHHLLPVFYSHALILMCSAAGISLIPLAQSFLGLDDVSFAVALEMTGWAVLYAALMPIIVHLRSIYRKKILANRAQLGSLNYFIPIGEYPSPELSSIMVLWKTNKIQNKPR